MLKELESNKSIVKAIETVDRLFDEEQQQLVYETRMHFLANVESKIASAEEKGREEGIKSHCTQFLGKDIEITTAAKATFLTESVIEIFLTNRKGYKLAQYFSIQSDPIGLTLTRILQEKLC